MFSTLTPCFDIVGNVAMSQEYDVKFIVVDVFGEGLNSLKRVFESIPIRYHLPRYAFFDTMKPRFEAWG